MNERSYRWLLWSLALVGVILDQGSKYGVFSWLYPPDSWVAQARPESLPYQGVRDLVPGVFQLLAQHTGARAGSDGVFVRLRTLGGDLLPQVNKGALFGLGNDYAGLANAVFALVSVLAAGAIIVWSRRPTTARDFPLCAALGLILAGTLGNLYDRIVFHGVRDFLYFYWINWPVFNVADCCLVCGACLLLFQAFCARQSYVPADKLAASLPRAGAEVNGQMTSPV